MLRIFLVMLLSCLLSHAGLSQANYNISFSETSVGTNLISEQPLSALEISLGLPVYGIYVDTINQEVIVQLRDKTKNDKYYKPKGAISSINVQEKKINWSKPMDYHKNAANLLDNTLIQFNNKNTRKMDLLTGKVLWEHPSNLFYTHPIKDIGMSYSYKLKGKQYLSSVYGIDLEKGTTIWQREIDRKYGWRQILPIDSSQLLISASGIHLLDITDGKGWTHNNRSGKERINFWTNTNTLYNISSDILYDSTAVYYCASTKLMRLNMSGDIEWSYPMNKELVSKSFLIDLEDDILLINLGFANSTNKPQVRLGKPFISRFSKAEGKQVYNKIFYDPKEMINSFRIIDNVLYLILTERVKAIDLTSGALLHEYMHDKSQHGKILAAAKTNLYKHDLKENLFHSIYNTSEAILFIYTQNDVLLGLDESLDFVSIFKGTELYHNRGDIEAMSALTRKDKTFLIDISGTPIYKINTGFNAYIADHKIYDHSDHKIRIIDIKDID